ncbi:hypothetical protein Dimus_023671 [Dionaea muscipula]
MAPLMSFFHHLSLLTIFGLLGNTISFMVFLSPIPTFYKIYKKKSTEGFQSVPYVVALFSAMLWISYALFDTDSTFLITINSFGCFIETLYVTVFLFYGTRQARILTIKLLLLLNVVGFGFIIFIVLVIAKGVALRQKILGWVCLIFSLSVFVAPLFVMRQVIRTKSVKYMPFLLSFFLTISAVMWFFFGLLKKDYYIAIPNVLGFSFGIVQMVLYAMYRKNSKEDKWEEEENPKVAAPKLPELTTDQIIEVVKLHSINMAAGQEMTTIELPAMATVASLNNINEGVYTIEIRKTRNLNTEAAQAPAPAPAAPTVATGNIITSLAV